MKTSWILLGLAFPLFMSNSCKNKQNQAKTQEPMASNASADPLACAGSGLNLAETSMPQSDPVDAGQLTTHIFTPEVLVYEDGENSLRVVKIAYERGVSSYGKHRLTSGDKVKEGYGFQLSTVQVEKDSRPVYFSYIAIPEGWSDDIQVHAQVCADRIAGQSFPTSTPCPAQEEVVNVPTNTTQTLKIKSTRGIAEVRNFFEMKENAINRIYDLVYNKILPEAISQLGAAGTAGVGSGLNNTEDLEKKSLSEVFANPAAFALMLASSNIDAIAQDLASLSRKMRSKEEGGLGLTDGGACLTNAQVSALSKDLTSGDSGKGDGLDLYGNPTPDTDDFYSGSSSTSSGRLPARAVQFQIQKSNGSKLCLQVDDKENAPVTVAACTATFTDAQQLNIIESGKTIQIKTNNGLCLTQQSKSVILKSCSNSSLQTFGFDDRTSTSEVGLLGVFNFKMGSGCLGLSSPTAEAGSRLAFTNCSNADHQRLRGVSQIIQTTQKEQVKLINWNWFTDKHSSERIIGTIFVLAPIAAGIVYAKQIGTVTDKAAGIAQMLNSSHQSGFHGQWSQRVEGLFGASYEVVFEKPGASKAVFNISERSLGATDKLIKYGGFAIFAVGFTLLAVQYFNLNAENSLASYGPLFSQIRLDINYANLGIADSAE